MMFNKIIHTKDISPVPVDLMNIEIAPAANMHRLHGSLGFKDVHIFKVE